MTRAMVAALAAMVLMPTVSAAQQATPGPTRGTTPEATATSTPAADAPRIRWASGGIELIADDLRLRVGDRVVSAPGEVLPMGVTYADHGQLEAWWYENGTQQRMTIELELDETHWWVDRIWAYDGHRRDSGWIYFRRLEERTRTPLGEPLEGDLRFKSSRADRKAYRRPGSAVLRLEGLRLNAFMPGIRPAPLTGCDDVVDDDIEVTWDAWPDGGGAWSTSYGDGVLQGPGEPLAGWESMTPSQAEAALQAAGLCYRFDHAWRPARRFEDRRLDRELELIFDRRCSAPATGELREVSFGPDYPSGEPDVIVYLSVWETEVRDWPDPPSAGTDCPSR